MIGLIRAREASLLVEANQGLFAEIKLATEVERLAYLHPRQQSPLLVPACDVQGGNVLIAPGYEGDASARRRHAQLCLGFDGAERRTAARDTEKKALMRVREHQSGVRPVVAGAAQMQPAIADAPSFRAGIGLERDDLIAFREDHEWSREDRRRAGLPRMAPARLTVERCSNQTCVADADGDPCVGDPRRSVQALLDQRDRRTGVILPIRIECLTARVDTSGTASTERRRRDRRCEEGNGSTEAHGSALVTG